jgi:hypothetical protein
MLARCCDGRSGAGLAFSRCYLLPSKARRSPALRRLKNSPARSETSFAQVLLTSKYISLIMSIYTFVKLENTGKVRSEGKVIHCGRRLATSEGRLIDLAGNLIVHGSETCMILKA